MFLGLQDLGTVGAIPGIGPIVVGVVTVFEILGSLFGLGGGGGDSAAVAAQVQQLNQALSTAVSDLTSFAWKIANALGKLLAWVHDFFVGLFATLWGLLKKLAAAVAHIVRDVLPLVLQVIRRLREFLNYIYLTYIRPILAWIQYLRGWLAILRIFHVSWAAKLDGYLVKLQGYILTPYLYVLRSINGIGSWVNVIITAAGLLQRAVFINSMYAYQGDWIPMWWNGQQNATADPPTPPVTPATPTPTVQDTDAQLDQFLLTDSGPMADGAAQCSQYLTVYLSELAPL